jgi:hypothetical protein
MLLSLPATDPREPPAPATPMPTHPFSGRLGNFPWAGAVSFQSGAPMIRRSLSRNFARNLGRIAALALVFVALASAHARAEEDQVQFFSDIHVSSGETVHDAVCFFCSVDLEGKASGDVVVFFGNTHIATEAHHDVVNFFGHVTADDNATIDHDIVNFFGGIRLGNNVHVGEDVVAMFGSLNTGENVTIDGDRVSQPAILFYGPLIFLVVVLVLLIREFRAYRRRVFLRNFGYTPHP